MTKNVLVANNKVFTIANVLSPAECAEYVALTENIGYTSAPITTHQGFEMRPDIRNNERVILDDSKLAHSLWQRVSDSIPNTIEKWQAIGLNERFRFYRYDPGQRFAIHRDGSHRRDNGEKSLLTFMIYLNDGFEGGETRFWLSRNYLIDECDVSVVPVTGMALCFVHELLHEGAPVIQGRKYVLRSDVMYSPV
jgi:predicted 2-oxoglutarate/Fe(II)-dependent dioxygenase YbiX